MLHNQMIQVLVGKMYQEILALKGWVILAGVLLFGTSSYVLLWMAGETNITNDWIVFTYFMATTASTVGYGDFSPASQAGMLIATFYIYPGGIIFFGVIAGKIAALISERIRKMAEGLGDFSNIEGATLIVGYHEDRTDRMIRDIKAGHDNDHTVILMAAKPAAVTPAGVKLVRAPRLDSTDDLKRASAEKAEKILVYADSDAETLNASLAVRDLNSTAIISAYFNDHITAKRAESLASISAIVSRSPEMLVRAVQDPGSESVLGDLITASQGHTIYSDRVPAAASHDLIRTSLLKHGATVIAMRPEKENKLSYTLPEQIPAQSTIYYIAGQRLSITDWDAIVQKCTAKK